jgi:hypothetical protein
MDLPLNPASSYGGVPIDMVASWTFLFVILKDVALTQDYTNLENHSWEYHASEFRRMDGLVVLGMYHFIITLLHVVLSKRIFTIALDDVVEILACQR